MIGPRIYTLALAALLALPGAAEAQARAVSTRSTASYGAPSLRLGAMAGFEWGDLDGFGLRLDGEMDIQRLAPNLTLVGVGSVGFSHLSEDLGFGADITSNIFTLVPAARFALAVNPQVGFYGDVGLGLYHASLEWDMYDAWGYRYTADDSTTGLTMRLGVGGWVQLNQKVRLGLDMALHPYFGDYDDNTFTFMVGAAFGL